MSSEEFGTGPGGPTTATRTLVFDAGGWIGSAVVQALEEVRRPCVAAVGAEDPVPGGDLVEVWRAPADGGAPPAVDAVVLPPPDACGGDEAERDWPRRARRLLGLAGGAGARRAVVVSGIEAVGPRASVGQAFEGAPEHPAGAVGRAHLAVEREALAFRNRTGAELVVLRAGHLYGDGRPGFLSGLLEALETAPDDVAAWWHDVRYQPLHVRDLARAAALAVTQGDWIYHVTTPGCPTVEEVVAELRRTARWKGLALRTPKRASGRGPTTAAVHYPWPCHRAERELGFQPAWTVGGGFADLVDKQEMRAAMERLGLRREADLQLSDAEREGDVFHQEGRFWDEQEAVCELLYTQPHDWAFDERLGNVIQAPVYRFLKRVLGRERPRRVLDLGCGNGVYSRWLARAGVRSVGIDLSAKKIARAREMAEQDGVAGLCDYRVGNALEFAADEPVDAVCAFGALHHLPDLDRHLPGILERNLRPGGLLVAVEPHCEEGLHPSLQRLMHFFARTWLRRFFDVERYQSIAADARRGVSLRGESPAGLEVHGGGHVELDELLRRGFDRVRIRYIHVLSPFVANAFVIYQRSRVVRGLTRLTMPLTVRLDGLLCRLARFRRWAALGLYAVRPRR